MQKFFLIQVLNVKVVILLHQKKGQKCDEIISNFDEHLVAFCASSDQKMQLLLDDQKQQTVSIIIRNKISELSDIDQRYEMYLDIIDDTTYTEKKRNRAQQKIIELKNPSTH